ncbi:MAG TPA: isoprenylcysteine carboxylmethyltransferase family protein [Chthoniobacteraceae bacterium]|jgi:protein-S-isoprenylcysteine O-methyltransferase Ste14
MPQTLPRSRHGETPVSRSASSSPGSSPALLAASGGNSWVLAGRRFFPWRIVLGVVALILGALIVRPRNLFGSHHLLGTSVSFFLVALGLMLRAWAAACAGGHTRSDTIEAPRLATDGPYAHVRNPIYLGSVILGLGMVGLLGDPWLILPHVLVFAVFFCAIVPAEEQFLGRQFGDEYAKYRRSVPKLLPRLRPYASRTRQPLRWSAARGDAAIALSLLCIYAAFRLLLAWRHGA